MKRLRRLATMAVIGAVFAIMVPAAPATATVPCRTIVGPVMYGIGTGNEKGVCVSVVAGAGISNAVGVMAGATPTGSGQPAYVWVSDSVCSGSAWCVFAGAGITKSGLSAGPFVYVCYIDQIGNGLCVPDLDPHARTRLARSVAAKAGGVRQALRLLATPRV